MRGLKKAALQKKSVVTHQNIVTPAGWMLQMQGQVILKYFDCGLCVYKPKKGKSEKQTLRFKQSPLRAAGKTL